MGGERKGRYSVKTIQLILVFTRFQDFTTETTKLIDGQLEKRGGGVSQRERDRWIFTVVIVTRSNRVLRALEFCFSFDSDSTFGAYEGFGVIILECKWKRPCDVVQFTCRPM